MRITLRKIGGLLSRVLTYDLLIGVGLAGAIVIPLTGYILNLMEVSDRPPPWKVYTATGIFLAVAIFGAVMDWRQKRKPPLENTS